MKGGRIRPAVVAAALLIVSSLVACTAGPQVRGRVTAAKAIDAERLGALVRDKMRSDEVRMKVAKQLAASSDPKALEPILFVIRDGQERPVLRAGMTHLLGRSLQRQPAMTFLVERLADEKEVAEVRAAAAASLGSVKDSSSEPLLRRAAGDPDPAVRLAARSALARIGWEGIDPGSLLIDTLQDPAQPDAARASAAAQLGALKDPRALTPLIQALQEKGPEIPAPSDPAGFFTGRAAVQRNVPAAAARALGRLGDPKAIPPLIDAAAQASGEAKVAIFEALAALKASQAAPAARTALSDPDQRVRRWAALLLREVGAKEALPELRRAIADEDPGVRLQAVLALESLNDRESAEKIREALPKEALKEVREAMEQALRTLTPTPKSPLSLQERAT